MVWFDRFSNPPATAPETRMLNITPSMRFSVLWKRLWRIIDVHIIFYIVLWLEVLGKTLRDYQREKIQYCIKIASNRICKKKSPLIKHNRIYRYRSMYTKVVFLLNLINTHCDNHKTFIYNTHFFIVNIKFITFQFIHSSSNSYSNTWYSTKYYKKTFGWYLHQLF